MAMLLALGLVAATQAPVAVEVPFRIGDDAIIVDALANGKKVSLMYDTGYSGAVILSDGISVGPPSGSVELRDFVGQFSADTVKLNSLKLGDRVMGTGDRDIVQKPADHYTYAYGTHVDGVLGLAPFSDQVFTIDFERRRFVFHPPTHDVSKFTPDNTRTFLARMLPIGRDSIEMSVQAPGGRMTLALDTGNAFYATTHKEVLERLALWPSGTKPTFTKTAMVASGPVDSFYVRLRDLKIYGVPVTESVWSIIDLPSSSAEKDGTVGFGFLKHFNVTVDMRRRRVWLQNWTGRVTDAPVGDPGLWAFYDPRVKRMRIYNVTPGSPADKAGVKRGDDLLGVDGRELTTLSFREVEGLLRGEPGTKVKVATSRNGQLTRHELDRAVLVNEKKD